MLSKENHLITTLIRNNTIKYRLIRIQIPNNEIKIVRMVELLITKM